MQQTLTVRITESLGNLQAQVYHLLGFVVLPPQPVQDRFSVDVFADDERCVSVLVDSVNRGDVLMVQASRGLRLALDLFCSLSVSGMNQANAHPSALYFVPGLIDVTLRKGAEQLAQFVISDGFSSHRALLKG